MIRPRLPLILLSPGKISDLPSVIHQYGKRVAIITGKRSFLSTPAAAAFFEKLESDNVFFTTIKITGEPTPEMIDGAVARLSGENVEAVVAIGGGSVLDAGKAISAMMYKDESVFYYLEGVGMKEHPGTKLPFIAVPTTAGTGSEATKNAVISRTGPNGFKRSLRHNNFIPEIAMIDPELTLHCPADITAASGMDCLSQLIEAFVSTKAVRYTDSLAREGLISVKKALVKCYESGDNIEARSDMAFAALTSGICLTNAGLGAVHGFASSIGGMYDIPHGLICGTLMAVANEVNIRKLKKTGSNPAALKKYIRLGKIFMEKRNRKDDYYLDGLVSYLHELTERLKLPGLRTSGVEDTAVEKIVDTTDIKNNPVALSPNDLLEILLRRLN